MSDGTGTVGKLAQVVTSSLERLTDARFLVLLISLFLYLDIWLLHFGIDPTKISLNKMFQELKHLDVFTLVIFVLSYSLLMAGFFPICRKIIGIIRIWIQSDVFLSKKTTEGQRLSDWSLAFIVFSIYDAIYGFFCSNMDYKGFSIYIFNILQSNEFDIVIFRLSIIFLWFMCAMFAVEVDDHSAANT